MIKCSNITQMLNNMYSKKIVSNEECLNGNHKYKANKIRINYQIEYKKHTLDESDNIYNPLSLFYHILIIKNLKIKKNKYAFNRYYCY